MNPEFEDIILDVVPVLHTTRYGTELGRNKTAIVDHLRMILYN